MDKLFILWDRRNGPRPPRDQDTGEILSGGCIGRIGLHNVYLRTYGVRPNGAKDYDCLDVGEFIRDVKFNLSGTSGVYDIYRVQ